jgi:hypothetical protein
MSEQWYYTRNGQQDGPVSALELRELAESGQLQPTDLVRKEGMASWCGVGVVEGLFPAAIPVSGAAPDEPIATAVPVEEVTPKPPSAFSTEVILARVKASWQQLSPKQKILVPVSAGVGLLFLAVLFVTCGGASRVLARKDSAQTEHTGVAGWPDQAPGHTTTAPNTGLAGGGTATALALDQRLVGTWVLSTSSTIRTVDDVLIVSSNRYITIGADSRFTDRTDSGSSYSSRLASGTGIYEANERGRVTQRGNVLMFEYDNGQRWSAAFELMGTGGLRLGGGKLFLKQP